MNVDAQCSSESQTTPLIEKPRSSLTNKPIMVVTQTWVTAPCLTDPSHNNPHCASRLCPYLVLEAATLCFSISISTGSRFSGHKMSRVKSQKEIYPCVSDVMSWYLCGSGLFQCCSCFRFTPCWWGGFLWLAVAVNFMLSSGGFLKLLRKWSLILYFRLSVHDQGYLLIRKRLGKWKGDLGLPLPQHKTRQTSQV